MPTIMRTLKNGHLTRWTRDAILVAVATLVMTAYVTCLFPKFPGQTYPFILAIVAGLSWKHGPSVATATLAMTIIGIDLAVLDGPGLAIAKPEQAAGVAILACVGAGAIWMTHRARVDRLDSRLRIAMLEEQLKSRDEQVAELTHRIRNDLGTLASLASLHGRNPETADVGLKSMGDRILVLGRLYQRLQMPSTGSAVVEISGFLDELTTDLMETHIDLRPISMDVRSDRALVQMRVASVIGLAVNEAVTNALKYAFPNEREGSICVRLHKSDDEHMTLAIEDDGVGPDGGPAKGTGMGTRLMRAMAAQIRGTYSLSREDGSTIARLRFPIS